MNRLAIIPARGGSKRLPGKNMLTVGGKTLVARAVECALESSLFDRVVVSSDDAKTILEAHRCGAITRDRGASLSADDTLSIEVVRDVLDWRRHIFGEHFEAVVLLQPTSPLRIPADIAGTLAVMKYADASLSVVETPSNGLSLQFGDGNRLMPIPGRLVKPNGAVFALKVSALAMGLDWGSSQPYAYIMPAERSVDIDTLADLDRARELAGDFYERSTRAEGEP